MTTPCRLWTFFWPLSGALLPFRRGLIKPVLGTEDFDNLLWWITQVLCIAACNQTGGSAEHYQCMTVQQGHYPNDVKKLHVTDSIEAHAVCIMENNYLCWPAQWEAKDEHANYPTVRKAKDEDGEEVTLKGS